MRDQANFITYLQKQGRTIPGIVRNRINRQICMLKGKHILENKNIPTMENKENSKYRERGKSPEQEKDTEKDKLNPGVIIAHSLSPSQGIRNTEDSLIYCG